MSRRRAPIVLQSHTLDLPFLFQLPRQLLNTYSFILASTLEDKSVIAHRLLKRDSEKAVLWGVVQSALQYQQMARITESNVNIVQAHPEIQFLTDMPGVAGAVAV